MGTRLGKAALVFACVAIAAAGCVGGTRIGIKQTVYAPAVARDALPAYKGRSVSFYNVTNAAPNTTIWAYYGKTFNAYYEALPTLQTYFWDCFVKGFESIGVRAEPEIPDAPRLEVVLLSVTDEEIKYGVTLTTTGVPSFHKTFTVTMPPAKDPKPEQLEARAYALVDAAFSEMVGDPGFRQAFLGK